MLCPMDTPITKVSLNAFDAIKESLASNADAKTSEIKECLRLRRLAEELEFLARQKAFFPYLY